MLNKIHNRSKIIIGDSCEEKTFEKECDYLWIFNFLYFNFNNFY